MAWSRPVEPRSGQPLPGSKKSATEKREDSRREDRERERDGTAPRTRNPMAHWKKIRPSLIFPALVTSAIIVLWMTSDSMRSRTSADVAAGRDGTEVEADVEASELVHLASWEKLGREHGETHTTPTTPKEREKKPKKKLKKWATIEERPCRREAKRPGSCDLYDGAWEPEERGPLYTNDTCTHISRHQNCRENGRPDFGYEAWRWRPRECDLERFDARAFLRAARSRTVAFVGDSLARNQYESLICLLSQVEAPIHRGSRRMQRFLFKEFNVTLSRIWSGWLVRDSLVPVSKSADTPPVNVTGLWLDQTQPWVDLLPSFDVLVLCTGHWMAKPAALFWRGELVGGTGGGLEGLGEGRMNSSSAFRATLSTALEAVVSHPTYRGLTVFRTYSPDHYAGGEWNTGGSCTGKTRPLTENELGTRRPSLEAMFKIQVEEVKAAQSRNKGCSRLELMDITKMADFRSDGHPGPYRSLDPNKQTKPGPDGRPPPQDCLHWCLPGPVDVWNEMLFELMRRDGYGDESSSIAMD